MGVQEKDSRRAGNAGRLMVRNGGLKAFHTALLRLLPLERVREFWRATPLRLGGRILSETDFYRHIWNERGASPASFLSDVSHRFERFLHDHGIDPRLGVEELLCRVNRGSYVT